jgi:hypothetical protein
MTGARAPQPAPAGAATASRLGHAGLIPFVLGAAAAVLLPTGMRPAAAAALSAYAAVIVSFLGGIHWGIGFRDGNPRLFLWGVLPSLAAAAALLLPTRPGLLVHALLLLCLAVDRRVYPAHGLQAWLGLRRRLSLVAATACGVAAAFG